MKKKKRTGICLDCRAMIHDRDVWETGECEIDGHKITHINNRTPCRQYVCPRWRYDKDPAYEPDKYLPDDSGMDDEFSLDGYKFYYDHY